MRHRRLQNKPGQFVNPTRALDRRQNPRFEQAYENIEGQPNLLQVRDAERSKYVEQFQPGCGLPNPEHAAPIDKKRPLPGDNKRINLGLQPIPDRLIDLPVGDAGAGLSMFRRVQIFAAATEGEGPTAPLVQYRKSYALATNRSSDARARFWHVSCFGSGSYRAVPAGETVTPLTGSQIKTDKYVGIRGGTFPPQNEPFLPSISSVKCRAMIWDESGKRFFDFDVIGTRSFDVYAFGVTVFLLLPDTQGASIIEPANDVQPTISGPAVVTDQLVSARVIPIQGVSGVDEEQMTVPVRASASGPVTVPIPPGAFQVQIYSATPGAVAGKLDYSISFDVGGDPGVPITAATNLGNIILDPLIERTSDLLTVPGQAVQIWFQPGAGAVDSNFVVIYKITV